MSDAQTDAYRMAQQSDAEDALDAALVQYALHKTDQHTSAVDECAKKLTELYRGDSGVEEYVTGFYTNNSEAWKFLEKRQKNRLFKREPELHEQFLNAAKDAGIAKHQLVIS